MPTASSARLLAAGVAGGGHGPTDRSFKSTDSLLFGSAKNSTNACKAGAPRGSHAQLSAAAGRLQQAAAGSLSSTAGAAKWGTWSAGPSLSPGSAGSATSTSLNTPGRQVTSTSYNGLLIKAKVTTTPYDRNTGSSSSGSPGAARGVRSPSAPRSHASFDAAKSVAQATVSSSHRQLLSPVQQRASAGAVVSPTRSSSTGRELRTGRVSPSNAAAGSSSAPGASGQALRSRAAVDATAGSSGVAAVPGRARVMLSQVSGSPGVAPDTGTHKPACTWSDGSSGRGQPAPAPARLGHSTLLSGSTDCAAAAAPSQLASAAACDAASGSRGMLRSCSFDSAGLAGSRKPHELSLEQSRLTDDLSLGLGERRSRASDAAARLTPSSSQSRPGRQAPVSATRSAAATLQQPASVGPLTASGSSYLARLHLQRAATADGASRSNSTVTDGATATRRVSSASSVSNGVSSSSKAQALEQLKAGRTRARPVVSAADAATGSNPAADGSACCGWAGAECDCAAERPSSSSIPCVSSTAKHAAAAAADKDVGGQYACGAEASSSRSWGQGKLDVQQQGTPESMDSAVASLTALLDRLNKYKQEQVTGRAAELQPQQQPQQQHEQQLPPGMQQQQGGLCQAHSAEQVPQQQESRSSGICSATAAAECGPGERLAFPPLQPQQPVAAPQSKPGSYLDVIRRTRASSKQTQPPPQQQQDVVSRQCQQQRQEMATHLVPQQPPGQHPQRVQQYHPRLYQQRLYQPPPQQQQQQMYQPSQQLYQPSQQQQHHPSAAQQQQHSQEDNASAALTAAAAAGTNCGGAVCKQGGAVYPSTAVFAAAKESSSSSSSSSTVGTDTATDVYRPPYRPPQQSAAVHTTESACNSGVTGGISHPTPVAALVLPPSTDQGLPSTCLLSPSMTADDTYCQYRSSRSYEQRGRLQPGTGKGLQDKQPLLSTQGAALGGAADSYQQQQGFLIGTQPMSEHSCDAEPHHGRGSGGPDTCADVAGSNHCNAVDAAARHAFLTSSAASSSAGSDDQAATAAADSGRAGAQDATSSRHSHISSQRSLQHAFATGAAASHGERSAPDAGSTAARVLSRGDSSRAERRQSRSVVQAPRTPALDVDLTSESDTDVSEMSSSLDSASSSDSIAVTVEVHAASRSARTEMPQYPDLHHKSSQTAQQELYSSADGAAGRSRAGGSPSRVSACPAAAGAGAIDVPVKAYARTLSRSRYAGLPRGCCGIRNLGNTCYQNSCVQLLGCVPELVGALLGPQALQLFTGAAADAANNRNGSSVQQALAAAAAAARVGIDWQSNAAVGPALQNLLCEMWGFQQQQHQQQQPQHVQQQLVSLQRVTDCMDALRAAMSEVDPRWDDGEQWDCQEALCGLLQAVHAESNRVRGKPQYRELKLHGCEAQQAAEAAAYAKSWEDSVVLDIFSWQLQSTMTCCTCGKRSHAFDSSQELLVAIPPGTDHVTVQECLSSTIFSPEKMHGEEGYKCEACKAVREATKQLQLFSYPQVLLLGLKRFETRGGSKGGNKVAETYTSRKVSTRVRVDARDVLDLSMFCNPAGLKAAAAAGKPPPRYELIAVADHSGFINGGHYTARCRCVMDGSWADFNDSLVTASEPPCGSSSDAYMMLYRLIGHRT